MAANVSFLGLNSSFDSANLVQQLVQLETQARVTPLQEKRTDLRRKDSFLDAVQSDVETVQTAIAYDTIKKGEASLSPKGVTTSDSDNEFLSVTADDDAVPQTFEVNVSKLATNTIRKSTAGIIVDRTSASDIADVSFKGGVTLSDGDVTINGETLNFANSTGTVADIETFLSGFTGVTATFNTVTGQFDLTGVTSLGSSGDDSNMISALGLDNAVITGGNVSGIQNLEAVQGNTLLSDIGVTGTTITINGSDITIDTTPTGDTLNDLITAINNDSTVGVAAAYDAINGELVLTNEATGALAMTISGDGDISAFNISGGGAETLGDNAEFSISTLNGGATLVSNDNSVSGLVEGLSFDLNKVTTDPIRVTIAEDPSGYKQKLDNIIDRVNSVIRGLQRENDSFSRSLISRIKGVLGGVVGTSGTDTYTSFIQVGLESEVATDTEIGFTGYKLTDSVFDEAFANAPDELNKLLWGDSSDPDNIFGGLSNGDKGILVQLEELLDSYTDPVNGIIQGISDSVNDQIQSVDNDIIRAQDSVQSYEDRLTRQYSQLDVISAQYQQQAAAAAAIPIAQ